MAELIKRATRNNWFNRVVTWNIRILFIRGGSRIDIDGKIGNGSI